MKSLTRKEEKETETEEGGDDPPFPYFHLAILLLAGFSSGVAVTSMFPYVSYMVVDLSGGDINHAGYLSGFVASSFMIGRLCSSYHWGIVADTIGRKPVFCVSCIAMTILSIIFGFSVNILMAIISRMMMGFMNPISGLVKTAVSEICCKKHQSSAMSIVSASWSVGMAIGPAIGGYTSRPGVQYPNSWLGKISLFQSFPYLLPNIVSAVISLVALFFIYFYFPETLRSKPNKKYFHEMININNSRKSIDSDQSGHVQHDEEEGEGNTPDDDNELDNLLKGEPSKSELKREGNVHVEESEEKSSHSFFALLSIKSAGMSILAYFVISFTSIAFDELLPLWALSEIRTGGLQYSVDDAGLLISLTGIPMILFTLLLFPSVANKYGRIQCYRFGQLYFAFFSFCAVCMPLLKLKVWQNLPLFPSILFFTSIAKMSSCTAFTAVFLLINTSVPSGQRGSVNGLGMTFGSIAKSLGPVFGSTLFAWSINNAMFLPEGYSYLLAFALIVMTGVLTFLFLPTSSFSDH